MYKVLLQLILKLQCNFNCVLERNSCLCVVDGGVYIAILFTIANCSVNKALVVHWGLLIP